MKTLAVTVANKRQERLFMNLADELGIEITQAKFKPLSTKDAATGIARKFTADELYEYMDRTQGGKPKHAGKTKRDVLKRIAAKSLRK